MDPEVFSTMDQPRFEFALEVRLRFTRVNQITPLPTGGIRSAVYVDSGEFSGPQLKGKAVPNSGGDYALFRPDDVAVLRRALHAAGRRRHADPAAQQGLPVGPQAGHHGPPAQMGLRGRCAGGALRSTTCAPAPRFETSVGKHDWLTKHVFVGIGERKPDGNLVRYYKVT